MSNKLMLRLTKAMDKAGKQTSKAIVKGKIMAMQKIAHAEATPEIEEVVGALERLKATKNEIEAMADVARYLYESRINQATYQINLSHQLRDSRTAEEDGWSKLAVIMGNSMSRLESIHSEHCEKMKEEFVAPLEKFRDVDVAEVQRMKLKYKETKSAYDVAVAKEQAAKDSGQAPRMQAAFAKKSETEMELKKMRDEFVKAVEGLERSKNTELLGLVLDYWHKYVSFAKAQHNALSGTVIPDDISPANYTGGRFQATTPGGDDTYGGPEFQTNFNENSGDEKNDNGNGNGEAGVAAAAAGAGVAVAGGGLPNPTEANDNDNDYNAEAQNSGTNPFGNSGGDDDQQQTQEQGGYNEDMMNNNNNNENQYDQTEDYNNNMDDMMNGGNQNDYNNDNNYNENENENEYNNNNDTYDNNENANYDDANNNNASTNPFGNDINNNGNAGGGDPLDFDPYANHQAGGQAQIGSQNY